MNDSDSERAQFVARVHQEWPEYSSAQAMEAIAAYDAEAKQRQPEIPTEHQNQDEPQRTQFDLF